MTTPSTSLFRGLNGAIRRILNAHEGRAVHYGEIYELIRAEKTLAACSDARFSASLVKEHLTSAGGVLSFATDELGYVTLKEGEAGAPAPRPSVSTKVIADLDVLLAARSIPAAPDASAFDALKIEPGKLTVRRFAPDLILKKGTAYKAHKDSLYAKQGGRCASCRRKTRIELCDVDHIVAHSQGGSDEPANLQVLCRDCNARKGSKSKNPGRKAKSSKPAGFFGRLFAGRAA